MGFPLLDNFSAMRGFLGNLVGGTKGQDDDDDTCDCSTRWERFIHAVNHAGRPLMLFGIILLFPLAYLDPTGFTAFAAALKALPDFEWYVILTIVTAWVGARGIADIRGTSIVGTTTQVNASAGATIDASLGRFSNLNSDHPALDTPPILNSAIEAWKKKNAPVS